MVVDSKIDWFSEAGNMIVAERELWTIGQDDNGSQMIRVVTGSGQVKARKIDGGRPLGEILRQGNTLLVADFERNIATIDPNTAARRVRVELDVIPNLIQFGPSGTYWVVDDDRARLIRVDGDGKRLVESVRNHYVAALAADDAGNAWLGEGSTVVALSPSGAIIREVVGFKNVVAVLACDGAVVASDVETGQLAWLDASGREQRVEAGTSGRAITCAPGGVWFVSVDGHVMRVPKPPSTGKMETVNRTANRLHGRVHFSALELRHGS